MLIRHPAPPLQHGDDVVTVAASSALADGEALAQGLQLLESWGLHCRPSAVVGRHWGYLAGIDSERRSDLLPEGPSPLLACARGGWGAARLIEQPMPWQPGWLLGFSDVTALLWSRLAAGFGGNVHGPLLTTLATEPSWSCERLRDLLFGKPLQDLKGTGWGGGSATGPLIVGNLTVATHLLGSRHVPNLNGAILIFEDVGEEPYRIDRMLTHWRLCGALQRVAAIGFGAFQNCNDDDRPDTLRFNLEQVLRERTADLAIPLVADLPLGHRPGNAALPLGQMARLDGQRGQLSLLASAEAPLQPR
ncbi:MAG: LD-carboxypeptidase [Cyanobium sp. NAT70]|nr:LD-carboxypeptidase [Cyanobium sp. NAT70]